MIHLTQVPLQRKYLNVPEQLQRKYLNVPEQGIQKHIANGPKDITFFSWDLISIWWILNLNKLFLSYKSFSNVLNFVRILFLKRCH